ncbi:DUF2115 domain-containing protein [Methanogenium organophilum]|uniref:UPF0305 protein OU421_06775 n=1 Tax=Methanogenium organophilum TaxID=2199 RepID=A0A9X9S227_METOG|nr:DUF2115 domain-containing protein [Methanogenium organophilum]WAI00141.1 DUF2115 domain-containing protein [Methanogenium organophilum]
MRTVTDPDTEIRRIAAVMQAAKTKGELGEILAREVKRFSRYDLTVISARVRQEVELLPKPYREKFRPYAEKWFFGRYHELLKCDREGTWQQMLDPITDRQTFDKFCRMIPDACLRDNPDAPYPGENETMVPFYLLFYYLLSAFAMYVRDEPGHPEGTPFPGGFFVHRKKGKYYCAIRDKEEEIWHSICNYCPALQDPENI